jgi:hypothetical protein
MCEYRPGGRGQFWDVVQRTLPPHARIKWRETARRLERPSRANFDSFVWMMIAAVDPILTKPSL